MRRGFLRHASLIDMKWLFFLRAFFPSWVFFTEATSEISLEVRFTNGSIQSEWQALIPQIQRSLRSLFWNPSNNFCHACQNSLHHLLTDVNEMVDLSDQSAVESLPSYQVVKSMVAYLLEAKNLSFESFQFRLLVRDPSFLSEKSELFLISPEYGSEP